jgi:hypothetical protein
MSAEVMNPVEVLGQISDPVWFSNVGQSGAASGSKSQEVVANRDLRRYANLLPSKATILYQLKDGLIVTRVADTASSEQAKGQRLFMNMNRFVLLCRAITFMGGGAFLFGSYGFPAVIASIPSLGSAGPVVLHASGIVAAGVGAASGMVLFFLSRRKSKPS